MPPKRGRPKGSGSGYWKVRTGGGGDEEGLLLLCNDFYSVRYVRNYSKRGGLDEHTKMVTPEKKRGDNRLRLTTTDHLAYATSAIERLDRDRV